MLAIFNVHCENYCNRLFILIYPYKTMYKSRLQIKSRAHFAGDRQNTGGSHTDEECSAFSHRRRTDCRDGRRIDWRNDRRTDWRNGRHRIDWPDVDVAVVSRADATTSRRVVVSLFASIDRHSWQVAPSNVGWMICSEDLLVQNSS